MTTGTLFQIKRYAIHDGPGIRMTIFFKGCPMRCVWCHNPEGQSAEPQERRCARNPGKTEKVGQTATIDELIIEIEKERVFFEESGGGVTISGGEPLMQPEFLAELLGACRERGIHTAVDTCGYAPSEVFSAVLEQADMFLFDLKVIESDRHRQFTGVANEQILANLRLLTSVKDNTVVRLPLISGYTDAEANLDKLVLFIETLDNIAMVQILPYHQMASGKYERLGMNDPMHGAPALAAGCVDGLRDRLEKLGLNVSLGGH